MKELYVYVSILSQYIGCIPTVSCCTCRWHGHESRWMMVIRWWKLWTSGLSSAVTGIEQTECMPVKHFQARWTASKFSVYDCCWCLMLWVMLVFSSDVSSCPSLIVRYVSIAWLAVCCLWQTFVESVIIFECCMCKCVLDIKMSSIYTVHFCKLSRTNMYFGTYIKPLWWWIDCEL